MHPFVTLVSFFRFMFAMYFYAVEKFEIKSITHKFLIRGHTQNEGDTTHSVIEKTLRRAKKSGPIYVPDQLVSLIRASKKTGKQFNVKELSYSDFIDLKSLTNEIAFNIHKNINGDQIKLADIKLLRFEKGSSVYYYKTSYKQPNWEQASVRITTRRSAGVTSLNDITAQPAYHSKNYISENKQRDLRWLSLFRAKGVYGM